MARSIQALGVLVAFFFCFGLRLEHGSEDRGFVWVDPRHITIRTWHAEALLRFPRGSYLFDGFSVGVFHEKWSVDAKSHEDEASVIHSKSFFIAPLKHEQTW